MRSEGKTVLLCAADTFRAAAIEQLEVWGQRTGTEVIRTKAGGDPSAVLYDALQAATARHTDYVIVDTAGRLHTKTNLMAELEKMRRTAQRIIPGAPHETLLVMDATTGQNGLQQARLFTQVRGRDRHRADQARRHGQGRSGGRDLARTGRSGALRRGRRKGRRPVALRSQGFRGFAFRLACGRASNLIWARTFSHDFQESNQTREPESAAKILGSGGPTSSSRENDEYFLRRALELARKGIGLTSPNPCVGAVIVDRHGQVVGEGSHTFEGVKHAEVLALEQAGDKARGATLYINLEPCSHQGRTGACADAVIAAGVRRVVACMQDPNPLVAGKGFERLRNAGISVASGILEEEAKALNEAFAKYIRQHTPLITLKSAMTLDGKIAPPPGELHHPTALGGGAPAADGSPAKWPAPTCRNCVTATMPSWSAWARSSRTIRCSPIAAACRGAGRCCG